MLINKQQKSVQATEPLLNTVSASMECQARNDRQTYFSITRELVRAQFQLADHELSQRLWQDVADRDLDVGRIIHLMYECWFHSDTEAMTEADEGFLALSVS
ncbi:hypothetical protein [Parasynechococcus sp.]|jgi:hypothetical protein|uniref:hypothetical protein n=1 Tax=Parasynechococcus sp. TaxID=3101203 RepID=UPI0037040F05